VNRIVTVVLVLVGLLNLYPVTGVLSAGQLHQLYGIEFESPDVLLLMQHRAVLFGLLGGFILYSARHRSWRLVASVAALVSMISFIILAVLSGDFAGQIQSVVYADAAGSLLLIAVLPWIIRERQNRTSHAGKGP